jgi:hypothetical protein
MERSLQLAADVYFQTVSVKVLPICQAGTHGLHTCPIVDNDSDRSSTYSGSKLARINHHGKEFHLEKGNLQVA